MLRMPFHSLMRGVKARQHWPPAERSSSMRSPRPKATARTLVPAWRTRKLRWRSPPPIRRGSPTICKPPARKRGLGLCAVRFQPIDFLEQAEGQGAQRHFGVEHQTRRRGHPLGKMRGGVFAELGAESIDSIKRNLESRRGGVAAV